MRDQVWEDPHRDRGRDRDRPASHAVVGPHAITAKGGVMKGLAIVMMALLLLATTLAFGVAVA
jgi:hypothetical protein